MNMLKRSTSLLAGFAKPALTALCLVSVGLVHAVPVRITPGSPVGYTYFNKLLGIGGGGGTGTPCTSQNVTWSQSGNTCSAPTGTNANNAQPALSSTNGNVGTGNFRCTGSSNTYTFIAAGSTCAPPGCTSQLLNWSQGGISCAANSGPTPNAGTQSLASTNANTGTGNFVCDSGTNTYAFQSAGSSCAAPPPSSCTSQTLAWSQSGTSCAAVSGVTPNGGGAALASTNGNPGTGNFTCNAGTNAYAFNAAGSSCTPPTCSDQNVSWTVGGATCSAQTGSTNANASKSLASTNGNSGTGNFTCTAGSNAYSFNASGSSCASAPPPPPGPSLLRNVIQVAAGGSHSCALLNTGGVKCWGLNLQGRLGDGTNTNRLIATDVVGLQSGVKSISLGSSFSCALMNAGNVKCWGSDSEQQLGNGTGGTANSSVPVDVVGLSGEAIALDVGPSHACVVTNTGGVKCWGDNREAQIGIGNPTFFTTYIADARSVTGLASKVKTVSAGSYHTCALLDTNAVQCWGRNGEGQISLPIGGRFANPTTISGLASNVSSLSVAGVHSCVKMITGEVKCWGHNNLGQIDKDQLAANLPVININGLSSGSNKLSGAMLSNCSVMVDTSVKCWGNGVDGQLGSGDSFDKAPPIFATPIAAGAIDVSGAPDQIAGAITVNGDAHHYCAVLNTGGVKCWGLGGSGQLGNGQQVTSPIPVDVRE